MWRGKAASAQRHGPAAWRTMFDDLQPTPARIDMLELIPPRGNPCATTCNRRPHAFALRAFCPAPQCACRG